LKKSVKGVSDFIRMCPLVRSIGFSALLGVSCLLLSLSAWLTGGARFYVWSVFYLLFMFSNSDTRDTELSSSLIVTLEFMFPIELLFL
jgi:hypothetical protein